MPSFSYTLYPTPTHAKWSYSRWKNTQIPKDFLFYVKHFQFVYSKYLWRNVFLMDGQTKFIRVFVEMVYGRCNVQNQNWILSDSNVKKRFSCVWFMEWLSRKRLLLKDDFSPSRQDLSTYWLRYYYSPKQKALEGKHK